MARRRSCRRSFLLYLVGLLVVGGAGWAVWSIWHDKRVSWPPPARRWRRPWRAGRWCRSCTVKQGPKERLITLLGDARPYQTATLYGKVGGYLTPITVDRGDMVKAGDVLAEIEFGGDRQQYASALSRPGEQEAQLAERAHDLVATAVRRSRRPIRRRPTYAWPTRRVAQNWPR